MLKEIVQGMVCSYLANFYGGEPCSQDEIRNTRVALTDESWWYPVYIYPTSFIPTFIHILSPGMGKSIILARQFPIRGLSHIRACDDISQFY